jgi:hypothetical protein
MESTTAMPPPPPAAPMGPPDGMRSGGYSGEKLEEKKTEREKGSKQDEARREGTASPYLVKLGTLARELEAQGRGRADAAAIRVLRQRLTEWIEDLRSVGGQDDLAAAVELLVQRLSAALALATDLVTETLAVAAELAKLAAGTPPPRKQGRVAFWK